MKQDNRGFTLVELLVSVVIFSIVCMAVFGFMIAGSTSYTNVQHRIDLQIRAQLTLNQVSQALLNANVGVKFENGVLHALSSDDSTDLTAPCQDNAFALSDGVLKHGSSTITPTEAVSTGEVSYSLSAFPTDEVAVGVDTFDVSFTPAALNASRQASARITLSLHQGDASYTATKTVSLRNQPLLIP
ncbi:MAG: PulJ/GspJ family protein [Oscillospiraceae bacterium]|jgi:prepilin-type N-terminal cleavage/methylation domain-containing protein